MRINILQTLKRITQGHAVIQHPLSIVLLQAAPLAVHASDRNQSKIPNAHKHQTKLPALLYTFIPLM